MATTRPTQSTLLRRTGTGLLTGAAACLALVSTPGTAVAAPVAPAPAAAPAPAPSPAQVAVDTAYAQVGKAYQYGAGGPDAFDCSGLTQFAYRAAGIELPHSSRAQSEMGVPVAVPDLQPGDLLFYYSPVSHVAIYIGNGQFVHAATESTGVEIGSGAMDGFHSARRIV